MTAEERKALVAEVVAAILAELEAMEGEAGTGVATPEEAGEAQGDALPSTLYPLDGLPGETELPGEDAPVHIRWLGVLRDPRLPSPIAIGHDDQGRPVMMVVATGDIYGTGDGYVWAYSPEEELGGYV